MQSGRLTQDIGLDPNKHSNALQQVIWSTSVQHGAYRHRRRCARGRDVGKMNDTDLKTPSMQSADAPTKTEPWFTSVTALGMCSKALQTASATKTPMRSECLRTSRRVPHRKIRNPETEAEAMRMFQRRGVRGTEARIEDARRIGRVVTLRAPQGPCPRASLKPPRGSLHCHPTKFPCNSNPRRSVCPHAHSRPALGVAIDAVKSRWSCGSQLKSQVTGVKWSATVPLSLRI